MGEQYVRRNFIKRNNSESGSIGIGAMIVFIALILVAAVASTVIIKLQKSYKIEPRKPVTIPETKYLVNC